MTYILTPRIKQTKTKKVTKKVLAIDFDGVIHDYKNPVEGRKMGMPFADTKKCMVRLRAKYILIVHTVKAITPEGAGIVKDWLKFYGIPYDEVTALKPNAELYIDDKALYHVDWGSTMKDKRL